MNVESVVFYFALAMMCGFISKSTYVHTHIRDIFSSPHACFVVSKQYFIEHVGKGPFNNYVDKIRGEGGKKMSVFVHPQGIKTVHAEGGGQKMAKFCLRSC